MTLLSVYRHEQAIANLVSMADRLPVGQPVQANFTLFIVVRMSGYIERATIEIYHAYASRQNKPALARFAGRRMNRRFWNPNAENLCQLAGDFDASWQVNLRDYLDDNGRKEAINGIVDKRHKIAHGDSINVGLWQVKDWYRRIMEYMRFVEQQVGV